MDIRFKGWGWQRSKYRRCIWFHFFQTLPSLNRLIDINEFYAKSRNLVFWSAPQNPKLIIFPQRENSFVLEKSFLCKFFSVDSSKTRPLRIFSVSESRFILRQGANYNSLVNMLTYESWKSDKGLGWFAFERKMYRFHQLLLNATQTHLLDRL